MNATLKKILLILCVSAAFAVGVNYLSYQALILISQAQLGSIPAKLIAEIFLKVVFHIFLLCAVPVALSARNKHLASYLALFIISSLYLTLMAGVNAIGPAVTLVMVGVLAFYGYKRAQDLYHYFRAK